MANVPQYLPGPYSMIVKRHLSSLQDAEGRTVAMVPSWGSEAVMAGQCRLFQAAPDLVAACLTLIAATTQEEVERARDLAKEAIERMEQA